MNETQTRFNKTGFFCSKLSVFNSKLCLVLQPPRAYTCTIPGVARADSRGDLLPSKLLALGKGKKNKLFFRSSLVFS